MEKKFCVSFSRFIDKNNIYQNKTKIYSHIYSYLNNDIDHKRESYAYNSKKERQNIYGTSSNMCLFVYMHTTWLSDIK